MPVSQVPFAGISNPVNFRNIVINGDMQVAQRATSVASITTGATYHTVDRWITFLTTLGTWTQSQSTDVPTGYGFANSLKMDCTAADASPAAADSLVLAQKFEGQNLQYLKKGTANALPLTASFWVKSTKTGTFICELYDIDNNRQISKSYTVSVTNTWEYKTITFPGDTTGAFDNNNAHSLSLQFWLGAGSDYTSGTLNTSWATAVSANRAVGQVNCADSTANDWLITGVQLEAGEQASGFEFMPIDVNINRCLRYFERWTRSSGIGLQNDGLIIVGGSRSGSSSCQGQMSYYRKRTGPSISFSSTPSHFETQFPISPFTTPLTGTGIAGSAGVNFAYFNGSQGGSLGSDCASWIYINNADGTVSIDAEL